jgi:predicted RND superfamily exporter protein
MLQRFVDFLISRRWPLLALGLVATALAWPLANHLQFDRSIENMFAPDDPLLAPYRQLKRTFGGDEIALAAYVDDQLLSDLGMERLERLTVQLEEVEGVESVFSLTRSPITIPFIPAETKQKLLTLFEGYTIGPDQRTAAVVCVLKPARDNPQMRDRAVDELRRIIENHDRSGVLTGEPVMIVDGFRYLDQDGQRLGIVSTVLLMLTIIGCFRSLRWVVVPMAVVFTTLLWTQALLVVGGLHLSMVSSMLWAIVTVVGIATVVHLIVSFREARDDGLPPREALSRAGASLAAPIFWSCATDAAGFGSLLVSKVGPVQNFGLMTALASLLVLVSIMLILPGLALCGRFDSDPRRAWGEGGLSRGLWQIVAWIEHRPRTLALTIALVTSVAISGIYWLDVETDFTKNFRASSPIVRSYEFVETRLGGAGVWDVFVPVPEQESRDGEFLDHVRRLEQRLRDEVRVGDIKGDETPGLTKVLSLTDALDASPLRLSVKASRLEVSLASLRRQMPLVAALYGRDPDMGGRQFLRIMLRARERQSSAQKHSLIEQVTRISREEFPEAQVTGFFVLLTRLIESTTRDQWLTFGIATLGIFAMVLAAFRNVKLALVALAPNAMPILMVTGLMGWLGMRINMGAAMIASVSMGLAVDSSIHYLTAFLRLREQGQSLHEALHAVHQTVGRAIVFSTLALIVGFSALALSQFVPTIYFGVLVSLTMFGGLLGNLVVLPLLLVLVYRKDDKDRTTSA